MEGGKYSEKFKTSKKCVCGNINILYCWGILLLIWPGLGLDVLCKVRGVFFLIYGLAKISSYFTKDLFQLAFQFDFGLGIVSAAEYGNKLNLSYDELSGVVKQGNEESRKPDARNQSGGITGGK